MPTLVLMCGLAFSGKSTLARRIASAFECDYVSLDDLNEERGLWGGHGIPVDEWEQAHGIAHAMVRESLNGGRCVIVDDTSSLRFLRDRFRDCCTEGGHTFALVYVEAGLNDICERMRRAAQSGERRSVSASVFQEHVESFEPPALDERPLVFRSGDDVESLLAQLATRWQR